MGSGDFFICLISWTLFAFGIVGLGATLSFVVNRAIYHRPSSSKEARS